MEFWVWLMIVFGVGLSALGGYATYKSKSYELRQRTLAIRKAYTKIDEE